MKPLVSARFEAEARVEALLNYVEDDASLKILPL